MTPPKPTAAVKPKPKRVAVIDGCGNSAEVHLYWECDGLLEDIAWPEGWPNWVSPKFLRSRGFGVVYA